ncbi:putative Rad60/SUMO-like domain-containing protein [Lupinus albus]|uniref:Putative Rad60/SUMO-like domain-containing protein n=1 Tax=Lupinus albus TaxID=3870 RepID=A0A6A4P986_LUPAL|nr:putative Rad60/SUMO-like domain-containing protein [Lupinus albus]
MAESTEEFEPLFDYTRVQPFNVASFDNDDDDEDGGVIADRKKKVSQHVVKKGKTGVPVVEIEDNDDDDWLPSPPKVSCDTERLIEEDSTLKKLRLKKQELVSFTQSAKNFIEIIEESAKREFSDSLQTSINDVSENTSKPPERPKILISVQDKDDVKQFRIFMDDKFERIVKIYADKVRCDLNQIALSFDGDKVGSSDTPASLGMEDGDIIEVHVKSR